MFLRHTIRKEIFENCANTEHREEREAPSKKLNEDGCNGGRTGIKTDTNTVTVIRGIKEEGVERHDHKRRNWLSYIQEEIFTFIKFVLITGSLTDSHVKCAFANTLNDT